MTPGQQQKLYEDIMAILGSIDWTDVAQLLAIVMGNAALQQQVTAALLSYIHKELQAEVHYVDWNQITCLDNIFKEDNVVYIFKWHLFILVYFKINNFRNKLQMTHYIFHSQDEYNELLTFTRQL